MAVRRKKERPPDRDVAAILDGLRAYREAHPSSQVESYRQNSASIRIRVIDPDLAGKDRVDRHDYVWKFIEQLPEDLQSQVTVLLLLTPEEVKTSFANMDFENPIPSRL